MYLEILEKGRIILLYRLNQMVLVYETKIFFISNRTVKWEGLRNWLGEVQSLKNLAARPWCSRNGIRI